MFEHLDSLLMMLDCTLNSKRKRHIVGGTLMSISLLFGGLSLTIMTIKDQDDKEETYLEQE